MIDKDCSRDINLMFEKMLDPRSGVPDFALQPECHEATRRKSRKSLSLLQARGLSKVHKRLGGPNRMWRSYA